MSRPKTIQEAADRVLASFVVASRSDGSEYLTTDPGPGDRPEWLESFIYAAHDDELPCDDGYRRAAAYAAHISELSDPEDDPYDGLDSAVPVYTHELLAWLDHASARAEVDEILSGGDAPPDLFSLLQVAWVRQAERLVPECIEVLREWVEDDEDGEGEGEGEPC